MTNYQKIYVPVGLRDLSRKIHDGTAQTCEGIEIVGYYTAAGVVSRLKSVDGGERNFAFYISEIQHQTDGDAPALIRARLTNYNSTTGETESALRASSELRLPINVKGYLEQEVTKEQGLVFIVEELAFQGRKFQHLVERQSCPVKRQVD